MTADFLDPLPIVALFALFALFSLVFYEIGFRVGRWWQDRMPGEQEGPTDMLVGSLLALMAFLLAVTMGMASDRFDNRRGMVLDEANAAHAVYLQADYLPEPQRSELKDLVREYVPLRIVTTSDKQTIAAGLARSRELHQEMWTTFVTVAETGYISDLMSSLGNSITELINLNETRVVAGIYNRVPDTVLLLLLVGSALSLGMVGYSAGLRKRRSMLSAVVLVLTLGVVLTLVIDLDRPQDGLVNVSQQPLIDVMQVIGPAPSS